MYSLHCRLIRHVWLRLDARGRRRRGHVAVDQYCVLGIAGVGVDPVLKDGGCVFNNSFPFPSLIASLIHDYLSTGFFRVRQSQVPASFGWRPLVAIRPRELLEGILELLVRLNDHGPLLVLSQFIAEYSYWLIVGKWIWTLLSR